MTVAADAILVATAVTLTWSDETRDRDWRRLCLWIVTMLMISPVIFMHYLTLLIVPFVQIASATERNRASRATWLIACASYVIAELWFLGLASVPSAETARLNPFLAAALLMGQFISLATAYVSTLCFCRRSFDVPATAGS